MTITTTSPLSTRSAPEAATAALDAGPLDDTDLEFESGGSESFRVVNASFNEGLSEVYHCALTLVSSTSVSNASSLLGRACALKIHRGGGSTRRVCGIVCRVEDDGGDGIQYHLQVTLVPALWKLGQRSNFRVYQDLNALEIVRLVLKDAEVYQREGARVENVDAGVYPPREYCVQFGETDLEFITRILHEEGLTYCFRHEGTTETLVIADGAKANVWPALPAGEVPVVGGHSANLSVESLEHFQPTYQLEPTGVTLRDYNFTAPGAKLDMTRSHPRESGERGLYQYPGPYNLYDYDAGGSHAYRQHDGARRAHVLFEGHAVEASVFYGSGNVTGMQPGMTFSVSGHEHAELNGRYLAVSVSHVAHAPENVTGADVHSGERYSNTLVAIPVAVPFRPPPTRKRLANGPQTATVRAMPGSDDEVHVDVHGRVRVEFHWDNPDQRPGSQKSKGPSCWVRVAQAWAGAQFGAVFIPRVGMEVVVTFLDGDPERPLITGCVYNARNMPPNQLPENLHKSTIKSQSTPGGNGFNELTFADLKDHERVYLHAQKDHDVEVRNDESTFVGRDQTNHVARTRTTTIDLNDVVVIKNNQSIAISHHGMIHAHDSLTLQVGQSKILMLPDRIVISSPAVEIQGKDIVDIQGGVVEINK